jgi:hypothetical protein
MCFKKVILLIFLLLFFFNSIHLKVHKWECVCTVNLSFVSEKWYSHCWQWRWVTKWTSFLSNSDRL